MRLFRSSVLAAYLTAGLLVAGLACFRGLPPQTIGVSGPSPVVAGLMVTCSTSVYEAEEDSVSLRFSWGDGDTSDWSPLVLRHHVVNMSHVWSNPGHVAVKAQARDKSGRLSEWFGGLLVSVLDSSVVKWVVDLRGGGYACPAVAPDGTIYVTTDNSLVALSPEGAEKWRFDRFGYGYAPVVGQDGTLYLFDGELFIINPSGAVVQVPDSLVMSSLDYPALGPDGTIYVSRSDTVVALWPDGSLRWQSEVNGHPVGGPAVGTDSSICWVVSDSPRIRVFRPDGTPKWNANVKSGHWVSAGERGSFTVVGNGVYTLDSTGEVTMRYEEGTEHWNGPSVIGPGRVLFLPSDDGLHIMRPDAQRVHTLHGWSLGPSVALDGSGSVYVCAESTDENYNSVNAVICLDSGLQRKWVVETEHADAPPGVAWDGTIYVIDEYGMLYALKGGLPPTEAPWPKFAHDPRNASCAPLN